VTIEETCDTWYMELEELQHSLESHEHRLVERRQIQEQALQDRSQSHGKEKGFKKGGKKKYGQKRAREKKGKEASDQENRKDHKNDDESNQEKEWKFDKRKVRCYNCKKFGHFAKECWNRDGAKNKPKNCAHLAQDETSYSEAVMLMARISCEDVANTAWYLDSGCSTHMTRKKEWFVKMEEAANGRIKFADNRSLVAEGSSRVVLQGNDGREVVIEEVLYVPGLKTNLISLGQLLQKGFVVTMKNNCLNIFDQNKQLVVSACLSKNKTFRVVMEAVKHQCFAMTRNESEWL